MLLGFNWNPDDTLFTLGIIQIKYYNLLWIAAFILGWYLMKEIFKKEGRSLDKLDSLFVYSVVSIMLGARLGHVFFYDWSYYQNHLIEILLPIRESMDGNLFGLIRGYEFTGFTGLASHGAAIAGVIGLYLYSRKFEDIQFWWLLDRISITCAIGGAFVRLGNFLILRLTGRLSVKNLLWLLVSFGIPMICLLTRLWQSPKKKRLVLPIKHSKTRLNLLTN